MREDVLEVSRFSEIAFRSTKVSADKVFEGMYRVRVEGELILHQVTRPQVVEGQVHAGEDVLRAQGETRLRQSDYNLKKVSVAGGTLKVKDEVKLTFDILARRMV